MDSHHRFGKAAAGLLIVAGLLSCQIALLLQVFPGFKGLRLDHPYYYVDFPILAYQIDSGRDFWAASHHLWGYDPRFLAGFVDAFLWNSNVILQAFSVFLHSVENWQVVLIFVALSALVSPPLFLLAYRELAAPWETAGLGAILMTWACFSSIGIVFLVAGMPTAFLVNSVSVAAYAAYLGWASSERPGFRWGLLLLPLAPLVHKTAFVILAGPLLVATLVHLKGWRWRRVLALATLITATLAINAFWLIPAFRYRDTVDFSFSNMLKGVNTLSNFEAAGPFPFGTYVFRFLAFSLAVIGISQIWKRRRKRGIAVCLAFNIFYGATLLFLGSEIGGFHAARYECTVILFALLPAGAVLRATKLWARPGPASKQVAALALLAALSWGSGQYSDSVRVRFDPQCGISGGIQKSCDVPMDALKKVAQFLHEHSDGSRIFLETEGIRCYMGDTFRLWRGLDFINSGYPFIFIRQSRVNFEFQSLLSSSFPGILQENDIEFRSGLNSEDFEKLAETYNVRWFVVRDDSLLLRAAQKSSVTLEKRLEEGPYRVFSLDTPNSFFLRGSGLCQAGLDSIRLSGVLPDPVTRDVVIKFHWVRRMRASGGSSVLPFPAPLTRLDLIRILNPSEELTITLE